MQREMPFFEVVGEPEMVAEALIARLRNEADAVVLCWAKRRVRYSLSDAAAILGTPKSHLSNILSGKKYLPFDFRIKFQALCGNWAIRQYEDSVCGFRSVIETPEQRRIRELESQIEAMRSAA
ncbi:conserved hypothetical protein [Cupriavidus taiwanensis]|uniref:hypothetical protein n=1 Tax=Cupriavidus taiwanensis TaxID=164546 RepID=UPI000E140968|nr:hypothetical protein [Cupriavidus taiwanensis]SOY79960.1 conserved hypothetical protein [Cupriavidus taiwanensis]SOY81929.1 conserved hypothetical protein [Cupriavidus taiwanensis]